MHFKISDQLLEMTKPLNLLILQLYCIRPCCSFENGYIVQGIRSCTCTRNGIEMHQCNIYVHSMQILPTDCNFSIHIKYIIHSRKMRSLTSWARCMRFLFAFLLAPLIYEFQWCWLEIIERVLGPVELSFPKVLTQSLGLGFVVTYRIVASSNARY